MEARFNAKKIVPTAVVLVIILAIFVSLFVYAQRGGDATAAETNSEYEKGTVLEVLTDNCSPDSYAEEVYRGEQKLLVKVTSGRYEGQTMLVDNSVGIFTDYEPVSVGQSVVLHISTESDGTHRATVYTHDREPMIYVILGLFILVTILVGGKTGAKSILGLVLTVLVLLCIFLPLLAKGWPAILTAFLLCSLITVACFVILDGCSKKVLCACIGTIAGMALAMVFGLIAQKLLKINGYQAEYADALYNERMTGVPFEIGGLLIAGVIISSLGAVMDVAMSISSALAEVKSVNRELHRKELWKSGMNIGRDMVGTMTNTLILAILGSSLILVLYIYSMGLPWNQLMSSSFLGIEVISSVASAIGVILAVPLTTLVCAFVYDRQGNCSQQEIAHDERNTLDA